MLILCVSGVHLGWRPALHNWPLAQERRRGARAPLTNGEYSRAEQPATNPCLGFQSWVQASLVLFWRKICEVLVFVWVRVIVLYFSSSFVLTKKFVMCLSLYECVSLYYIFHRLCLSVGLPSLLITPINCQTSCLGYLNCWENWKMKTSVIYSLTDWPDHLLDCVGQVKNIYCGVWKITLMLTDLTFEENMIW